MKSVRLITCFPALSTGVATSLAVHPPTLLAGKADLETARGTCHILQAGSICAKKPFGTKQWLADPCRPELDGMSLGGRQGLNPH